MALYGPFGYYDPAVQPAEDGSRPQLPGFFCITEPGTFATFEELLTPYRDQVPGHVQNVLAGDNPEAPIVTVTLHFDDMVTAREVMAQVNGPPPLQAPGLPDEVAMERILIVLNHAGMNSAAQAFIDSLPEPQKTDATILFNRAPKLVVGGTFARQFKAFAGISDAQWDQLIAMAVNLPL